jgi:hypothetical protein
MVTEGQIRIDPTDNDEKIIVTRLGTGWRATVIVGGSMTSPGYKYPNEGAIQGYSPEWVEKHWPIIDEGWLAKKILESYE